MKTSLSAIALTTLISSSVFIAPSASAVEGLSANAGVASNYLWRGVTQTDDSTSVFGGIDYDAGNGFTAGTWVSNVDFGDDASYEADFYFGYGGDISEDVSYSLGYVYYAYPDSAEVDGDNEYNFGELNASLTYSFFTVAANYGVTTDDGADIYDGSLYISGDAEFEIAKDLTLTLHVGNFSFDDDYDDADYTDYGVSVSKGGFTFAVSDTDIDNDDVNFVVSYAVDFDL